MTVSIRRMSLGAGYRYLMESVARGDHTAPASSPLTQYYTQTGTPPGYFLGAGLAGLADGGGIAEGAVVSEEHLFRMLGMLQDPITGKPLGRPPNTARVATLGTPGERASRQVPAPVAGFDLTFSAPKSVSVAWALGDGPTRSAVYDAHRAAVAFVLDYAERSGLFCSRTGKNGTNLVHVRGVVATGFDHWDSRSGDPQMHTHVVVLNRAQGIDGLWRTLDSRGLFRSTVGLSELYNGVLSDYLTAALGWGWEATERAHSPVPKFEVAGVPEALTELFSKRSAAIEEAKNTLVTDFVASRGRSPSTREVLQLRQRATLSTRPDKQLTCLADLVTGWRARAQTVVGGDPVGWASGLAGRNNLPVVRAGDLTPQMLEQAGAVAVGMVTDKRATFGHANVFAEVVRQFHGVRFASPADRVAVVEQTVDLGLSSALLISPGLPTVAEQLSAPAEWSAQMMHRRSAVYTTTELLDAETRLLERGRAKTGPVVPAGSSGAMLAASGTALSIDQVSAVEAVVTSGRVVDVLVGAAGTGKTTAMAGVRSVWEARFGAGSVVGLAPSAAAAEVLADEVGIPTENTAKWLVEQQHAGDRLNRIAVLRQRLRRASPSIQSTAQRRELRRLEAEAARWTLRPGQLVIVDEASMAGTVDLEAITSAASAAGAKLMLVGDPAQLSPVQAGGAFGMLVADRCPAPQLHEVRRFRHEWERTASLRLRDGDSDVADVYVREGRVVGGGRRAVLDELFFAWSTDVAAGLDSLMLAPDAETVRELNDRARDARIAHGDVVAGGARLTSGAAMGVGDVVLTRRNDRHLITARGWVKNGDRWTVTAMNGRGEASVRRVGSPATVQLPADYVRDNVELGYATTAHRAQGRTVDTAHVFVAPTTTRETLYVMASRGRGTNRMYVDTSFDPDGETTHAPEDHQDAADVLRGVIRISALELSATQTMARSRGPRPAIEEAGRRGVHRSTDVTVGGLSSDHAAALDHIRDRPSSGDVAHAL